MVLIEDLNQSNIFDDISIVRNPMTRGKSDSKMVQVTVSLRYPRHLRHYTHFAFFAGKKTHNFFLSVIISAFETV